MSLVEIIAALCGAVAVWLTTRQHILNWPIGLVQVALYVFVFYEAKLYSDMILHVIYIALQFYGWYNWLHGGKGDTILRVSRLAIAQRWVMVGIVAMTTCI